MLLRARWSERWLLLLVAACGLLSVAALNRARPSLSVNPWQLIVLYLALVLIAHLVVSAIVPRADQTLLPMAAMLSTIGLVFVARLRPEFATKQLLWHAIGLALLVVALPALAQINRLRDYKYIAAAVGLGLMIVTAAVGREINGSRLWLGVGSYNFQVTEAMKLLLVLFLAGYLADRRLLLRAAGRHWRGVRLPTLPYLLPMGVIWVLTFLVLIWQRDLGATLLLAGVTLLLLYVASGRFTFITVGVILVVVDVFVAYQLFGYVRGRVDVWLHPFSQADTAGYQISQALYAVSNGSVLGAGIGSGFPTYIPAVHTDFVFAAIAEDLGLAGAFGLIALYLLFVLRGLRVAMRQPTDFTALLALGCTSVMALQALVIIAGNLALIPITGITLPLVSYGGSSILANYLILAVLLRLSARGAIAT
ncbi:MAG: FtsW/RodA/SpoVE family cell cycle protein [Chloroflexi bacterium]|nr:FtsW/RodA/SpoVE family cell cycle protein [Chloroflexota bacterium]